jgi:hypothetical protein
MKTFYGNYLGIVITGGEKDPEGRGRTQIFIPNVMPALYENWNEEGKDITFEVIGQGLEGELSVPIMERLRQILPWAECAAPIIGSSPSYKPNLKDRVTETLRNVGKATLGVATEAVEGVKELLGLSEGEQVIATISPKDKVSSGPHLDVRWTPGTKGKTDVPPLDLVGKYISVGGIPANELRVTDGPTGPGGKNFGTGRSLERHPAWDLAFQKKGAIAGAPVSIKNGAKIKFSKDSDSMGSAYADIETPEGSFRLYHLTTGSVGKTSQTGVPGKSANEQPGVSPSALSHPSPVTSMPSDPTQENALNVDLNQQIATGQDFSSLEGSATAAPNPQNLGSIDGSGFSDNELKYMMRVSAAESGVGANSGSNVRNELNDPQKRVGYANGFSSGSQSNLKSSGQGVIDGGRFTNGAYRGQSFSWSKVDIGFLQTNPNDSQKYGFVNSGSYKDQIMGSAGGLRNYLKNRKDGPAIQAAIDRGDFATADKALDNYWFGLGRAGGQRDMNSLENLINTKYGGDTKAALEALNGEYGSTTSIEEMSKGQFTPEASSVSDFNAANQPSTHTPTPHHGISGPNTNNQSLGMFGYASEGQAVWVFFREGNPLSPVYFAASYGQKEWGNMYQYNSPLAVGAGDGGAIPGTEAMALNTYGGGLRSAISTEESPLGMNFSFQLYDKNGSNLSFLTDHTEFNSMYNHVNRVLGNHHDINEANKEVRVRGDFNNYVEQDFIVTVGNWSDEAIAASDEIQSYINEAMEIKSKTS